MHCFACFDGVVSGCREDSVHSFEASVEDMSGGC
jgi:hypothetical protein